MSDEAIVRIILQDEGGDNPPSPPPPNSRPPSPSDSTPPTSPSYQPSSYYPPNSPSPPPAGSRTAQQAAPTVPAQQTQQGTPASTPQSTTAAPSRPRWVDDLISGFAKSVKDLATQLAGSKVSIPSASSTISTGGILQPLQQAQTSLPQFITSIPPTFSQLPYQSQPPLTVSSTGSSLASTSSTSSPQNASVDLVNYINAEKQKRSDIAKRAAETRRKTQDDIYAEINRSRLEETIASEGAKEYIPIEEELAKKKRTRANELARERYRKKQEAKGKTVKPRVGTTSAGAEGAAAAIPTPPPTTSSPMTPEDAAAALAAEEAKGPSRNRVEPRTYPTGTKPTFTSEPSEGEGPPRFAIGGKLPRMATGGKGWWSKIFGIGQKEVPSQQAEISYKQDTQHERYKKPAPISYDPNTWGKNNKLIDSLRDALVKAGYTPKDASNLASDKDILEVWKMNAPHSSPTESLAKLRKSGVLRYGPYDAPHFTREFEKHKKQQEILLGKSLEEIIEPEVDVSIPQAPPPTLPQVRLNKKGQIITARKGKKPPPQTETAQSAEEALPLTRKRPKKFFGQEERSELPDLPPGLFSGGGQLPRMARGGKYPIAKPYYPIAEPFAPPPQLAEVPVGKPVAPELSDYAKRILGSAAQVEFRDPLFDVSNKELLDTFKKNQAVPLPKGSEVSDNIEVLWRNISRLMPDAASIINEIVEIPKDKRKLPEGGVVSGVFNPDYNQYGPTGKLSVNPDTADIETIWYELTHAEQHLRGDLYRNKPHDQFGNLTEHGKLIESEAHQRGLQGKEIYARLVEEVTRQSQSKRAEIPPTRATGGEAAPMAIVGDTPGQSIESIKADPHTEVIMGDQVVPHHEAVKHGLFDGSPPKYSHGGQLPRYAEGKNNQRKIENDFPEWDTEPGYPIGFGRKQPPIPAGWEKAKAKDIDTSKVDRGTITGLTNVFENRNNFNELSKVFGNAGGATAASSMIPVAGQIYEAAKMMSDISHSNIKTVIGGASGVANWAASADADPGKTIASMGDSAAKAGEALSSIIPGAGLLTSALGETGKALGSFMQEMNKTVERYGEVSPVIAQQQAIGEIRQVMGDMRRASEAAPEIIRYMQVQQDLQQKFEDIKIKVLTKILAVVTPILDFIDKAMPMGEGISVAISTLLAPLQLVANAINVIANRQSDLNIPNVQDPADIILENGFGAVVGNEIGVNR